MPQSLIDHAYDYLSNNPEAVKFNDMWNYVKTAAELTEAQAADKVSFFYTNLMLDGRFVTLGDNTWDLRVRHTFDKVHIDMKDVYSDVETEDDDAEENEDIKEEMEEIGGAEKTTSETEDEDGNPIEDEESIDGDEDDNF